MFKFIFIKTLDIENRIKCICSTEKTFFNLIHFLFIGTFQVLLETRNRFILRSSKHL